MVSIIIPIYNVELYLHDCLESLNRQTIKDFEVIFVDDCSSDTSVQILELFLRNDCKFKYTFIKHETNRGLGAARNTGVSFAKGDFYFFLDSDDTLCPNAIEHLLKDIKKFNVDAVFGSISLITQEGSKIKDFINKPKFLSFPANRKYLLGGTFVCAWGKLYTKKFFHSVIQAYPTDMKYEDVIPFIKMVLCLKKEWKIMESDSLSVNWRQRTNSLSKGKTSILDIKTNLLFCQNVLSCKDFLYFLSKSIHWYQKSNELLLIYRNFSKKAIRDASIYELFTLDSRSVKYALEIIDGEATKNIFLARIKLFYKIYRNNI